MRKYPQQREDADINPLHLAIIEAAEKGVDWEHVLALLSTLSDKGLVDAAGAWDKSGRSLVGALMECRRSGFDACPPEEVLELAVKLDPQALTRPDPGKNTPVDLFLDDLREGGNKNSRLRSMAHWWLTHAPKEALLAWIPKADSYRDEPNPRQANGYYILSTALRVEMDEIRSDHSLLLDVARLGINLNARNRDGESPLRQMRHVEQWEDFMANGGDPHQEVEDNEDRKMPLWRYLVDRTHETASKAARSWAEEHLGDTMKQKAYDDYWARLRSKTSYTNGTSEIPGIVREHPDYLTLRDPEGRTVAMYVIQMHASAYKNLQQKQYQEMVKLRDGNGHSLWHYALSKGSIFNGDVMRFLIDSRAPLDPNPKTGRGLIPSMLLDFQSMHQSYDMFPRDIAAVAKTLKKTSGLQWFAASEADWKAMGPKLEEALGRAKSGEVLAYIASEFIDAIPDPDLREKIIRKNITGYGASVNATGVCKFFELGYGDDWSQQDVDALRNKLGAESFEQVKASYEARKLEQATQSVQPGRKGPRL